MAMAWVVDAVGSVATAVSPSPIPPAIAATAHPAIAAAANPAQVQCHSYGAPDSLQKPAQISVWATSGWQSGNRSHLPLCI